MARDARTRFWVLADGVRREADNYYGAVEYAARSQGDTGHDTEVKAQCSVLRVGEGSDGLCYRSQWESAGGVTREALLLRATSEGTQAYLPPDVAFVASGSTLDYARAEARLTNAYSPDAGSYVRARAGALAWEAYAAGVRCVGFAAGGAWRVHAYGRASDILELAENLGMAGWRGYEFDANSGYSGGVLDTSMHLAGERIAWDDADELAALAGVWYGAGHSAHGGGTAFLAATGSEEFRADPYSGVPEARSR